MCSILTVITSQIRSYGSIIVFVHSLRESGYGSLIPVGHLACEIAPGPALTDESATSSMRMSFCQNSDNGIRGLAMARSFWFGLVLARPWLAYASCNHSRQFLRELSMCFW